MLNEILDEMVLHMARIHSTSLAR